MVRLPLRPPWVARSATACGLAARVRGTLPWVVSRPTRFSAERRSAPEGGDRVGEGRAVIGTTQATCNGPVLATGRGSWVVPISAHPSPTFTPPSSADQRSAEDLVELLTTHGDVPLTLAAGPQAVADLSAHGGRRSRARQGPGRPQRPHRG